MTLVNRVPDAFSTAGDYVSSIRYIPASYTYLPEYQRFVFRCGDPLTPHPFTKVTISSSLARLTVTVNAPQAGSGYKS